MESGGELGQCCPDCDIRKLGFDLSFAHPSIRDATLCTVERRILPGGTMPKTDISVGDLVSMIERGELQLPEMQRRYVWTSPAHSL